MVLLVGRPPRAGSHGRIDRSSESLVIYYYGKIMGIIWWWKILFGGSRGSQSYHCHGHKIKLVEYLICMIETVASVRVIKIWGFDRKVAKRLYICQSTVWSLTNFLEIFWTIKWGLKVINEGEIIVGYPIVIGHRVVLSPMEFSYNFKLNLFHHFQ